MIKYLIAKIKLRKAQKRCYKANKNIGWLTFDKKCKGHFAQLDGRKIPQKWCATCPYFKGVK